MIEGQALTPQQFAEEFELLGPEDRIEVSRLIILNRVEALRCITEDHAGAVAFARNHHCPDSIGGYVEGYQDGSDAGHKEGYRQGYETAVKDIESALHESEQPLQK